MVANNINHRPLKGPLILEQALDAADARLAEAEDERIVRYINLAFALGERHGALLQEKTRYQEEDRFLRTQIIQLKLVHETQYQAQISTHKEKIQAIANKIHLLISEVELFMKKEKETADWHKKIFDKNPVSISLFLDYRIAHPNGSIDAFHETRGLYDACERHLPRLKNLLQASNSIRFGQLRIFPEEVNQANVPQRIELTPNENIEGRTLAENRIQSMHAKITLLEREIADFRSINNGIQLEKNGIEVEHNKAFRDLIGRIKIEFLDRFLALGKEIADTMKEEIHLTTLQCSKLQGANQIIFKAFANKGQLIHDQVVQINNHITLLIKEAIELNPQMR